MSQPVPQSQPPEWPPRRAGATSTPPSGRNLPYPPPDEPQRTGQWRSYVLFGGITLFIGCIALIVVALSR
jgi:hypothetical protein